MKNFLLVIFLGLEITMSAQGSDDDLSADSTAERVSSELSHQADLIIKKHGDDIGNYPQQWVYRINEMSATVGQLNVVSPKVLLDVLNQTRPYDQLNDFDPKIMLERETLFKALMNSATDANLPDLLVSQAPEALWVVCNHPSWRNNPAVSSFLIAQLKDMPSNEADDRTPDWIVSLYIPTVATYYNANQSWMPSQTWEWTVLNLASVDADPIVQKQFMDTIQNAIGHSDTRALFLCNALEVVSRGKTPQIYALASGLMERLGGMKFPSYRDNQSVTRLVSAQPGLLKDPVFTKNAISFLKASPVGADYYNSIMLARLGDSMAFADTLSMYFINQESFQSPDGNQANQQNMQRQFNSMVERDLLRTVVYHGPGDPQQGIKDHYRIAIFQDGRWVVTDPNNPSLGQNSAQAASLPPSEPTPHPAVAVHPSSVHAVPNTDNVGASARNAPITQPNSLPELPVSITVTGRAPIEKLDSDGHAIAVAMTVVGTTYTLVRVDGDKLLLKDSVGNGYRLTATATDYSAPSR